ncbi:MAG TPA: hypothetical protein VJN64_01350, partial [Terriglobales bacterium]|nr:hypothetical protein [Terriglobales bacterium]
SSRRHSSQTAVRALYGATEERPSPTQIAASIFMLSVWDEHPMHDCGELLPFPLCALCVLCG